MYFALLLSLTTPSLAQVNLSGPFGAVTNALKKQGTPTPAVVQNPREPSGFPEPPSREGELPPPRDYGPDENHLQVISVGSSSGGGNHVHFEKDIHVRYKGYDVFADLLEGDQPSEIYTASGHVRLVGADEVIKADSITIDFRKKTFKATKVDADLKPSFFPNGGLLGDAYVKGGDLYGSSKELWGDLTSFTTCNLPDPHFELIARNFDLRPGKRIILRRVDVWLLHKKIFTVPFLSIPLDDRSNHLMPEVGSDPFAGYYLKLKIPIALHGNSQSLLAHVDEFTKLGQGLGADYGYQNRLANGMIQAYGIFGHWNQQDLNLHHDQRLGKNDLTLDASYANNDWQASPGSQLLNLRTQFSMPQANGSFDQVSYSTNHNSGLGFSSLQESVTLNDTRVWNPLTRSTLSLAYSNSSSNSAGGIGGTGFDSKQLDVQFDATTDLKKALAEFQYMKNIPIGASSMQFFGTEDQTPVVTIKTDSSRILSTKLSTDLPFQTDLSFGQFGAPSTFGQGVNHVWRTNFDFNFTRPDHPDRRFDYTLNTRFQQGIYSDDTAQYVNGLDLGTRYNLGRDTAFNVRYDYLAQHGFTPLDQDRVGQTNLATADISFRPLRTFLVAAQTGYDFLAYQEGIPGWQSVGLRTEWTPVPYFQLRSLSTYDTTLKSLSNVRVDFGYKPGATFLSGGFLYDGIRHTIGEYDIFVDGFKWGRLKTSMVLSYDGYLHEFTARHFSFTYDLHCAEAVLQVLNNPTGFRSGTQIAFFIRLKAFPFNTPFGIGNQGQAVGAGTGRGIF